VTNSNKNIKDQTKLMKLSLQQVADVIGILARQCKANFLPYFQECAPLAFELLVFERLIYFQDSFFRSIFDSDNNNCCILSNLINTMLFGNWDCVCLMM
jgi:hypothetical protein